VLIISEEAVNQALPVATVVCLTTLKPGRKIYSIEVLINPEESGLPHPSLVMAYQVRSIAKERLTERCGYIAGEVTRANIKKALKAYLDLL
jgi:mRNA interferase MazF